MASSKADCHLCDKTFSSNTNLRKHLKNMHFLSPAAVKHLVPRKKEGNFEYVCSQCPKSFNSLKNFKYHNRVHNQDSPPEKKVKCPICVFEGNVIEISKHFSDKHEISYEVEHLEFDTWNTFVSWKKLVEKRTRCKFNLKRRKEKSTAHYICHRSGFFKSKGKNLRRLKIQGSKKINGFCPAAIDVVINKNGCRATFISTHVGHSNDLEHIRVSPTKREEIARQLQLKIPASVILSNIRGSIEGDIEKEHLLTSKDLHNIKRNMCKRVHKVCKIENEKNNVNVDNNNANAHCSTSESPESVNDIVISTKNKNRLLVDAEKDVTEEDLKTKFHSVLNSAKTKDHRKLVMKYLDKVQLCIESDVLKAVPVSKKDTTSTKTLYSTRKKQARASAAKFQAPQAEEKSDIGLDICYVNIEEIEIEVPK